MKQRFINHINSISDPALRATCNEILLLDKFLTWPASLSHHHAYEGGLLAHTVEVADIALATIVGCNTGGPAVRIGVKCNVDVLIAAALFHDVLKVEEYRIVGDVKEGARALRVPPSNQYPEAWWIATDFQKTHGHIYAGAASFHHTAMEHGVSVETSFAIQHCILAHHGRKEWGSPVEPQTLEALILHQADMLSAKFGATKDKLP